MDGWALGCGGGAGADPLGRLWGSGNGWGRHRQQVRRGDLGAGRLPGVAERLREWVGEAPTAAAAERGPAPGSGTGRAGLPGRRGWDAPSRCGSPARDAVPIGRWGPGAVGCRYTDTGEGGARIRCPGPGVGPLMPVRIGCGARVSVCRGCGSRPTRDAGPGRMRIPCPGCRC